MKRVMAVCLSLVVISCGLTQAGRIEQESHQIDAEGAKKLDVEIEFGLGRLRINTEDMSDAATLDISYDPKQVEYDIDYDVRKGTGRLVVETTTRRKHHIEMEDNSLDLVLSRRYPVSLELDVGACEAKIDLGGLPLEYFELEIGAASGKIEFSQPNPIRLIKMSIDAGASSLDIRSIGNANFDLMTFDGGAGSFDLDFRGQYEGESKIDIDLGVSSADIILPRGVPVRIETGGDSWLSSIDIHNRDLDEIDDGVYESPDFNDAQTRIRLDIEVGLGSVDIFFKK